MERLLEKIKIKGNDRDNQQVLMMATAAAVAVAVPLLVWSCTQQTKRRRRRQLQRTWSFTSEGMRLGVFPSEVQAPPTIINAALYFSAADLPSVQALADQVVTPLLQYDRLALIFDKDGVFLRPSKTGYAAQDLIRTIVLPHLDTTDDDEGESVLHKTMFDLLSQSLDSNRDATDNKKELPMWEFVRLENNNKSSSSGRSVLLFRVHHCIGDGLSLVSIFDKILTKVDGSRAESRVTKALLEKKPTARPSLSALLQALGHVLTLDKSPFDDATVFWQQRHNPHRSLVPHTSNNNNKQQQPKHAIVLFPPVPLEYIKALRQAAPVVGTTVNDLLMCVISQAIYDYCKLEKDEILADKQDQLQCRALLPVSLPRQTATTDNHFTALRNLFCMVSADLSVGCATVQERLHHIHATTSRLKTSPTAFVQLWLQNNLLCHLPYWVGRQTAHDIFARHSLVLTNVPGPEHECVIANGLVRELQLFFPNVIPQVDLMSYAGTIYGNFIYNPTLLPHGDRLATLYAKALVTLGTEWGLGVDQIPAAVTQAAAKELA